MNINWKTLIICLAIPLAVGGAAALLSGGAMESFESLNQPPLSPPGWLFPVVWTILYILMGIASYLCLNSQKAQESIRRALYLYGAQLLVNFIWPILFFNLKLYLVAFIWLVLLWILVLITAIMFYRLSKPAGYLLLPYILWVTFAGYLNLGIYLLN